MIHIEETISVLIARIKQKNNDKSVIKTKLYELLQDVTNEYNRLMSSHDDTYTLETSNEVILKKLSIRVASEHIWEARNEVVQAIKDNQELIKKENNE